MQEAPPEVVNNQGRLFPLCIGSIPILPIAGQGGWFRKVAPSDGAKPTSSGEGSIDTILSVPHEAGSIPALGIADCY